MSTGNAFAAAQNGTFRDGDHQESPHDSSRPSKRQRTVETAPTPLWLPYAQSETALEVDIMILDHLAFQATMACLESRKPSRDDTAPGSLRRHLELVDSFKSIFGTRHPEYQPDDELRLRLLLLRLSTLFSQRFTLNPTTPDQSSLRDLRKANRERAEAWTRNSPGLPPSAKRELAALVDTDPIALDRLERNRAHVLHQLGMPAEDEDYEDAFYGTAACMSLLDLLPLFVELSAASSSIHGSSLTERWMHLACEFMLQACLEQYLVCGARDLDVLDEAFAWGYAEGDYDIQSRATGRRPSEINDMFEDETYAAEVEGWATLKHEYVSELTASATLDETSSNAHTEVDVASRLESVAANNPLDTFEASTLKFLEALSISIAKPILVQLENGKLDGMSEEETKDFLAQCGVDPQEL